MVGSLVLASWNGDLIISYYLFIKLASNFVNKRSTLTGILTTFLQISEVCLELPMYFYSSSMILVFKWHFVDLDRMTISSILIDTCFCVHLLSVFSFLFKEKSNLPSLGQAARRSHWAVLWPTVFHLVIKLVVEAGNCSTKWPRRKWKSNWWEARESNEDVEEKNEDGKLLRAGGLAVMIVSAAYSLIYKPRTFCNHAAIQTNIKTPNIRSCHNSGDTGWIPGLGGALHFLPGEFHGQQSLSGYSP